MKNRFNASVMKDMFWWTFLRHNKYVILYLIEYNREKPVPKIPLKSKLIGMGFALRRKLGLKSQITPWEAFLIFSLACSAVLVAYFCK